MTSVSVFIDYENTRFGAREIFGDPQRDPYTFGHVRPLRLGLLLKQLGEKVDPARELTAVNVYRGRPAAWRAEEKGIDVMMALDIAIGARDDAYDVAVVVSADTDLAPAIEVAIDAGKRVETAMWWSPEHPHRRMKVPDRRLWNHALDASRFAHVRDDTDYTASP